MQEHLSEDQATAIPILPLTRIRWQDWRNTDPAAGWAAANGFTAEAGSICPVPGADGALSSILFGWDDSDPWCWAHLPAKLPKGVFRIDAALDADTAGWAALGWSLACYQFNRYQPGKNREWPVLVWPAAARKDEVRATVEAYRLVRDLVNTPSSDMGPEELAAAARDLADRTGGQFRAIVGDALLSEGYPAVHAVGRASVRAPRLIDLTWGDPAAPRVTLVGKGVCFDSGGLDIKGSAGMKLMKKDMGGAAHALGLASLIVAMRLPVRLRVLIPAVENSVSGNAFRPLDVLPTRKGLTVEVGNTDAEGRLILADALAEADRDKPGLIVDMATLTGAARTALGPDLPAMFTPDDDLAGEIEAASRDVHDPLWRLPLWKNYRRMLDSKVADINNASDSPFAGAVTAALFLQEFVSPGTPWVHFDLFAWNPAARPGRPEGGEAMVIRALYRMIARRHPS